MNKKLILKEVYDNYTNKFPYIDNSENLNRAIKFYSQNFSEGTTMDSIKKLCTDGLKKLSKASKQTPGINDSEWMQDVNKIRNTDNDEEIKTLIDKNLRKKFSSKNLPEEFRVGCIEASWITYSMNREAGRGKIVSWILAWGVMTRFLYWKIIGQNKVSKLNSYIRKTVKHPILFTLSSMLIFVVITLIPFLLGYASLKAGGFSASEFAKARFSGLFGALGIPNSDAALQYLADKSYTPLAIGAMVSGIFLGFISIIKGWLLSILFMLNTTRSNKAEDIVDVGGDLLK